MTTKHSRVIDTHTNIQQVNGEGLRDRVKEEEGTGWWG